MKEEFVKESQAESKVSSSFTKVQKVPLCVFALSPSFTIHGCERNELPASRRPVASFWRPLPPTRRRFKPHRTYSYALAKYLTGRVKSRQRDLLSLQEVLNTLKEVWISPKSKGTFSNMDERFSRKNVSSSDTSSPVLLRRRLSAPETIMRKHMLVQQRSQDSDIHPSSDVRSCHWRLESGIGSDSNLSKRRDIGFMRKSTLMRRLWGSHKPLSERSSRFSSSYYDWHYGKSSMSLNSNSSSPEHIKCRCKHASEELKTPPLSQKVVNPKLQSKNLEQHKISSEDAVKHSHKSGVASANSPIRDKKTGCSNCTSSTSFANPTSSNDSRSSTTKNAGITEADSENYSTRSTITTVTDNSDSAYTNTNSNFTNTSTESSTAYTSTFSDQFVEENGNIGETECQNVPQVNNKLLPQAVNDNCTQTATTTNLNVISNIQLSQSTLNLIFNQVMQDAQKSPQANINISHNAIPEAEPHIIQVKQVPSFYLKREEDKVVNKEHDRILKCMVSNGRTDNFYKSSTDVQRNVVPRYSALPRTMSMEVNTSSADSTDKEDNVSLVDSLEGSYSPYMDLNQNSKYDDKPVRGDISPLLPDNSTKPNKVEKASVFFIPIEKNSNTEVKSVADHLPEKVRERLSKRQTRRQQKCRETKDKQCSPKSDSNYVSASDNGNQIPCTLDNNKHKPLNVLPDINSNKSKKKTKPLLPNIESMKKSKSKSTKSEDVDKPKEKSRQYKKKIFKSHSEQHEKPPQWMSKTQRSVLESLSPLYITKRDYAYNVAPNRIYHKTEFSNSNKHIEILEIVDCIGPLPDHSNSRRYTTKTKHSKIPILVQSKLPSISKSVKNAKPTYLDFEQNHEDEPKIDQLIANILIDALNKNESQHSSEDKVKVMDHKMEKRPPVTPPTLLRQSNKYQQKFEAIPEERSSVKSSSEDTSASKKCTEKGGHKEEATGEYFSSASKGWVTFYTIHKSQESSESTSDEGRTQKLVADKTDCKENLKGDYDQHLNYTMTNPDNSKVDQNINRQIHVVPTISKDVIRDSFDTWSSSDQEKRTKVLYPLPSIYKNQPQKKNRTRNSHSFASHKPTSGEWTVTVSGVTSGREFAPDLEMRLTFPHNNKSLPPNSIPDQFSSKKHFAKKGTSESYKYSDQLPDIKQRGTKAARKCESSRFGTGMRQFSIVEPRQTRTSTRRLLLNRPREYLSPGDYLEIDADNSHVKEILKKIPQLLNVTGNAISPERKPRAATMSEKDITKHMYRN